ncbi:zinc metallopeptidase [Candidatus Dojkabacteria bacterium]|nr:zinc metallopeptidase [Candidatus Dojkabacteria bacterium]
MFYIDPLYILLALPALLVGLCAQILVRYFYSKYSNVGNSANISGVEVVERLAREHGLNIKLNVSIAELSDHYNPLRSELTLSDKVARFPSVASVGIAAHEMGHALQHQKSAILMTVRNFMIPVVNIGSTLGYIIFILGLTLQFFEVAMIGIAIFSLSTLFTIITLPIEIDASIKALRMIRKMELFSEYDIAGIKNVLIAAALTYVAAVMQSLSILFYYILRAFGMRKRR